MNAILKHVAVALVAVLYLVGVTADAGWNAPYTVDANTLHLWHFDEADPGPAADTGNGTPISLTPQDGAFLGSTTAYAGFGTAADTTDASGLAELKSGGNVAFSDMSGGDGAFTIEALVRTSDTAGTQQIICMDTGGGATRVFQFRISGSLRFLKIYGVDVYVTPSIPNSGDHAFVANQWFHVAVTYNGNEGESNNLKMYWTRVGSSVTNANLIGQGTLTEDLGGSALLTIGNFGNAGSDNHLRGQIDEVRISNIARDADDMIGGVFVPDTDPPDIAANGLNPTNGTIDVARNANLVATFDEEVALKDGGVITISNLTDTVEYAVLTLPTNTVEIVDGTDLTINLASPLDASTEYQVTIGTNAVVDTSANSNAYTGLVAGNWTFTTAAEDNTAPTLIAAGLSPADNAEDIAFDAVLVAPFSEAIALANGGVITITDLTDGSGTMTLTLPTNVVTIADGTNLTIDLASDFEGDTEYQITIDGSAVVDTSPNANAYTGLGAGVWTFTTRPGSMRWAAPYTADTNTLHLWHFDEADPGPAVDTGNGTPISLTPQDGAFLGFTTAYAGFGTAADSTADGLSELNSITNVAFSDMSGANGAFTIEALIRTSEIGAVQQIVCMDPSGDRVHQFRISYNQLNFTKLYGGTQTVKPAIPSSGDHAFVSNEWFHVAVTYNGNEGVADNLKLYWTRVSESVTEANLIGQGTLNSDLGGSSLLSVGNYGSSTDNHFKGQIDEVRISDIARDPVDMTGGEVLVRMGTIFKFR